MTTRAQNERRFGSWEELPRGGRLYRLEVPGRLGWRACYLKEVDAMDKTVRFWQEIYNDEGTLVEVHEKYPLDKGHRKAQDKIMVITKQIVARQIESYLRHDIKLAELVDWAENVMMEGDLDEHDVRVLRDVVARLGLADVRVFGLTWEDCEQLLNLLGYSARVKVQAV